MYFATIASVR
jgi:hypothetical protein